MTLPTNRVLVCDTEPIAVAGLRAWLDGGNEFQLVGEETSLAGASEAAMFLGPNQVVVEKSFGIPMLVDWMRRFADNGGSAGVIVWGNSFTEADSLRLLRSGARGVIRKTSGLTSLMQCLRTVASGGTWMDSPLMAEIGRPGRGGHSPLTTREQQVMELVEGGLKNRDIGEALGISTGTVKIHLKHIFEKTGIRGRYGLALTGLKEKGLLAGTMAKPV